MRGGAGLGRFRWDVGPCRIVDKRKGCALQLRQFAARKRPELKNIMAKLSGIFTPNLVPFDARGRINEGELRRMVNWLIEKGVSGLYPQRQHRRIHPLKPGGTQTRHPDRRGRKRRSRTGAGGRGGTGTRDDPRRVECLRGPRMRRGVGHRAILLQGQPGKHRTLFSRAGEAVAD